MKRFLLVILCLPVLMAFHFPKQKQPVDISGLWSEHWIESDVNYVDTLRIGLKNDQVQISLHNLQENWDPNYYNVKFDGSVLSFQMDANNITNFFVFQLMDDQKKFEGKVYTWRGEIFKMYLLKESKN